MKTVAAIVVVLALLGMFPKHKHKHQQLPPPPAAVSQMYSCMKPEEVQVDSARVDRIVKFGSHLYRTPIVGEATLRGIASYIVRYATSNCIEPELAAALIARESGFNPNAVSPTGAKGLGQLIDSTARKMGVTDPFDVEQNVRGSIGYFKQLLDIWNGYPDQIERALASYNAGPKAVQNGGPGVSQRFVTDILKYRDTMQSE